MNINDKLSQRRKELGLTLEDVGKMVGVGKSTVRKWETGDIANMKRDKIALLAKALKVSPAYIMGWEETKPADNADELDVENDKLFKNLTLEKKQQALEFLRFLQGK